MYVEICVCVLIIYTSMYMYLQIYDCVSLDMHSNVCICVGGGWRGPSICMYTHVCSASSEWVTHTVRWHLWGCYDVCGDSGEGK